VQINGPGLLEHPPKLDQARGHHRQIGHHVRGTKKSFERAHGIGDATAALDDFLVGALGVHVPSPVSSKAMIWEAERVPSRSAKSTL
jgi:hypothetical protein